MVKLYQHSSQQYNRMSMRALCQGKDAAHVKCKILKVCHWHNAVILNAQTKTRHRYFSHTSNTMTLMLNYVNVTYHCALQPTYFESLLQGTAVLTWQGDIGSTN